jgi:hypothetical protein
MGAFFQLIIGPICVFCLCNFIMAHKQNTPIGPIINWKNVFAYEPAKYLTKTLRNYLHL